MSEELIKLARESREEIMEKLHITETQMREKDCRATPVITAEMVEQSLMRSLECVNDPASFNNMCRCDYQLVADRLNEMIGGSQ